MPLTSYAQWEEFCDSDEDDHGPKLTLLDTREGALISPPVCKEFTLVGSFPQAAFKFDRAACLGTYKRVEGTTVNAFPTFQMCDSDGAPIRMLWRTNSGLWQVGDPDDVGKNAGVLSGALTKGGSRLEGALWRVSDGRQWLDAPLVRCVDGEQMAAAMAEGAATVHLVGTMPRGTRTARLGTYDRTGETLNGRPTYKQRGVPEGFYMWYHPGTEEHPASVNAWRVGSNLGGTGSTHIAGPTLLPEDSQGWRALAKPESGTGKSSWVDAPSLRCITDAALKAEHEAGSRTVHVVGFEPSGQQRHSLGAFDRVEPLVNHRPQYKQRHASRFGAAENKWLWWNAKALYWSIGYPESVGKVNGVALMDDVLLPEHAQGNFKVYSSLGGVLCGWMCAPDLRILGDTAIEALLGAAPQTLHFVGATVEDYQRYRLGTYDLLSERTRDRPVYRLRDEVDDEKASVLFYEEGRWKVGPLQTMSTTCDSGMRAADTATLLPGASLQWEVWGGATPAKPTWHKATLIRCLTDAAWNAELEKGASIVYLIGWTIDNQVCSPPAGSQSPAVATTPLIGHCSNVSSV